jgi:hypothetical protein
VSGEVASDNADYDHGGPSRNLRPPMSSGRSHAEKIAVTIAALATTWLIGATLFYKSGGVNTSGLLPVTGSLIGLWGAVRTDPRLMWFGTGVVVLSVVLLVFSVGLVVVPAAVALVLGSLVLKSALAEPE